MKTNLLPVLLIAALAISPAALAAKSPAERFTSSLTSLDELIKDANLPTFTTSLAPILKAEAPTLSKALVEQKLRFSDVVVAQIIADKTGKQLFEVLQPNITPDWLKALEDAKVDLSETLTQIGEIHTDVAFALMDQPKKKGKK